MQQLWKADLGFLLAIFLLFRIPDAGTAAGNSSSSSINSNASSFRVEQRLVRTLLHRYDTDARGVSNVSRTVRVEIELMLLRIQHLDERSQLLTTTGHIICNWQDDRLRWAKEDFNNLEDVVVKPERIWLPELALMNGAEQLTPDFSGMRVLISHTGHVHWEPGGVFTTTCDIDVRYFPFDDQQCSIQFGAWAYYSGRMNITSASPNVSTHAFRLNGEWELLGTSAEWKENTLACCPDTRYPYVEFTLHIRRRQAFYVINVIVPCTLLSFLSLIVFCLPPDAGEKVSLGISVVLAIIVFLLTVAETVPRTSLRVPVMVIYLTCTMALGTISVCLTVMVLNLHHRDSERPVPKWARAFVLGHLAKILRISPRKPNAPRRFREIGFRRSQASLSPSNVAAAADHQHLFDGEAIAMSPTANNHLSVANSSTDIELDTACSVHSVNTLPLDVTISSAMVTSSCSDDHRQDWKEVAHVMDRLYFWLMLVLMSVSTLVILFVPYFKNRL